MSIGTSHRKELGAFVGIGRMQPIFSISNLHTFLQQVLIGGAFLSVSMNYLVGCTASAIYDSLLAI